MSQAYLKVWIGHTSRDLFEQWLLDFLELRGLNDIQNLLDFTQEHHLIVGEETQGATSRSERQSSRRCGVFMDCIPLSDCRFWARTSGARGSPAKMTESFMRISTECHGKKKKRRKQAVKHKFSQQHIPVLCSKICALSGSNIIIIIIIII